jgi:hypothetical protein
MRRLYPFLIGLTMLVVMATPATARKYGDTLRILAIGNSFSDDGMEHLPALLEDMGIENVELARLHVGGCTLERHMQFYDKKEAAYIFYHSKAGENKWVEAEQKASIQEALSMGEWDIITMQQASGVSGLYESYVPHLERLINVIKAAQPNAELVWHMTWSYSTDSNHNEFPNYDRDQRKMYRAITDCVHRLLKDYKIIDKIIPSGTAIQSLRESAINNSPKDFTRDGYHMDFGAGRYALACTWYEVLIRPYARRSMMGNGVRLDLGDIKVTDLTAPYCQKAAKQAAKHPFKVKAIK